MAANSAKPSKFSASRVARSANRLMRLDREEDQEALLEVLQDYFYSRKPKKSTSTSTARKEDEYISSDSDSSEGAELESEVSDDEDSVLQNQGNTRKRKMAW